MFLNSLSLAIEYKFLAAQYCKFNEIPCLSYRFFIAAARAWNDNNTVYSLYLAVQDVFQITEIMNIYC